jgi:hypothetical protein
METEILFKMGLIEELATCSGLLQATIQQG